MTAPDDPIRRGDVEALIRMEFPCRCADLPETNDGLPNDDVPCDGCFSSMALRAHLRALPADPVAEAAGKLAEATDAKERATLQMQRDMETWRRASDDRKHVTGRWADKSISEAHRTERAYVDALDAYRAAVAARAKGGES